MQKAEKDNISKRNEISDKRFRLTQTSWEKEVELKKVRRQFELIGDNIPFGT